MTDMSRQGAPGKAKAPAAVRTRPTLEDVAAHAGVSRATASRVINKVTSVDPQLAEVVRAAVVELKYVPNHAARSLMTRRSGIVSLLVTESDTRIFSDPFFAGIVRGVSQELNRVGVTLVLSMARRPEELDRLEEFLREGRMDGALVISEHGGFDVVTHTLSAGIPLVMGGRPFNRRADVMFVDNDNEGGAAVAARRLRAQGRRRIATVAGPQDMIAGVDRLVGFRREMGEDFDPELVEIGDFTTEGGVAAAKRLVTRAPDVDGLFVASDLMALGVMGHLQASGRVVPDDVAVVGFDDMPLAQAAWPSLTTVRQRTVVQGRLMAQLLLDRLGHDLPERMPELATPPTEHGLVLDVELVIRQSG